MTYAPREVRLKSHDDQGYRVTRINARRFPERSNNFGALRLLFAFLVIVAHAPILIDGNRSRELLTMLFGPVSLGEVGVDGFFLVSGYLITQSFVTTPAISVYLVKRFFRIVPGYVASFAICVLLVAPWVGGHLSPSDLLEEAMLMLTLFCPGVPAAFAGLHYATLNGSMWTIAYECRCYVATIVVGLLGLYRARGRVVLLAVVACLLLLNATASLQAVKTDHAEIWGEPAKAVRLFAVYGVGALYFVYRDTVRFTAWGAAIAAILLVPMMFSALFVEAALAILGGYILFWFAFAVRPTRLSRFTDHTDISYGLYLYAWPIQSLLIYNDRTIEPWLLIVMSTGLAGIAGYLSWILVEAPSMRFARCKLAGAPRLPIFREPTPSSFGEAKATGLAES